MEINCCPHCGKYQTEEIWRVFVDGEIKTPGKFPVLCSECHGWFMVQAQHVLVFVCEKARKNPGTPG